MDKEYLKEFEGKDIKLVLKGNFLYNGRIVSIAGDSLKFKDKFGDIILISLDNIKFVRENVKNGK